jgi:glycosyltransferase involved in cell wall biosynthesis
MSGSISTLPRKNWAEVVETPDAIRPIRVLHLNSLLTGGGTDDQCAKLAGGLQKRGHDVCVAGPEGRLFSTIIKRGGVPFRVTPPEGLLKSRFMFSAAKFIRAFRTEIVHAHHGRDYWPAIIAARISGMRPKIVFTRHLAKSPSSWPSRRFLLRSCDALVAVSNFVAEVLKCGAYEPKAVEAERRSRPPLRGDHSKIHVIHGGMDVEHFKPFDAADQRVDWKIAPEHFAFAVAGGFDLPRGKGQREFLQAAARIHKQAPKARFLIIGRGSMESILRADIAKLGLHAKAFLTGQSDNMPRALNAIDCLVHPQIGTEAFGLVVCEAHACGKPVIASDLDGIPEAFAVANYGQLIPPENVDALAQAMLFWANQPRADLAKRENLHRVVGESISLERMARDYETLYRGLMGAPVSSARANRH